MLLDSSGWEAVIHNMEEGLVILDRELNALDANRAALDLLGLESPEEVQEDMETLIEPQIRELVLSGVEVLNAPLVRDLPDRGRENLLLSFLPCKGEGKTEIRGVFLLVKPGILYSLPPVESWLEWGRGYLNQVTSNLHEAICYLDREGRIVYANRTFEEIAGRSFNDMAGKTLPSVLKPVSRPLFLMEILEKTLREGSWQGELEIECGSEVRSLLATAAQVRGEDGKDLGIAIMARDITERKALEREMRWRNRELSMVYDLLQLTAGYHDMEDTLRESLSRILSIIRAEAGAIYLRDRESGDFRLAAYQGLTYRSAKELASNPAERRQVEAVMSSSEGVIMNEKRSGGPLLSGRRGSMQSVAAAPIPLRDRQAGVLMVGHKSSSRFKQADLSVLLSLASQIGVIFELTGLLEELRGKLEELGRERDFSRALVDTMPSALALLDERGRFTFVNRRFSEILGYELDDIEGKAFSILLPEGTRKKTMGEVMTRMRKGSVWMEVELLAGDGGMKPILLTSTPRPYEAGEYRGVIVTITDLSRQMDTEREVLRIEQKAEKLKRELAGTRDSLLSVDARKQAYLSMLHHEIAAPLKLLRKRVRDLDRRLARLTDEEARSRLQWMGDELMRLERLASDIRDVSSVERGSLRLRRRETDLRELTSRVVDEMSLAGDNPVTLDLTNSAVRGLADASRLEQVLVYLVENAMKYSPGGSGIKVTLKRSRGIAHWEVEDEGTGMDEEQLQRLLDLLAGRIPEGGEIKSGWGLLLCSHIVNAHGGDFRLESQEGRGTRASISIPLQKKGDR